MRALCCGPRLAATFSGASSRASYSGCRAWLSRPDGPPADDASMHTPQPDYPTPVEPIPPEPSPNDPKPYPQPMQ